MVQYVSSLRAPWLVVNAPVRRAFANEDGTRMEWIEGSIYHIGDLKRNPYRAVSVAWVGLDQSDGTWAYRLLQTDNECSPWDLQFSAFVLAKNFKPRSFPQALRVGDISAALILDYLKRLENSLTLLLLIFFWLKLFLPA